MNKPTGKLASACATLAEIESRIEALLAERDALRDALEHCLDSLGSEYAMPPECIKQACAALQGEQP